MPELLGLFSLNCFFGVQSTGQVIDYRQQLTRDITHDALVGFAAFTFDSLAIVFKVRLAARDAFLGLIQRGLESFQLCARGNELRQIWTSESGVVGSKIGSARFRVCFGIRPLGAPL